MSGNVICAGAIVLLGLAGAAYVLGCERRISSIRKEALWRSEWSAYGAGALLGLVATVSMVWFGRRLSGSGAYQELAGPIGRTLAPTSAYWSHVVPASEHWNTGVLVGAIMGSAIAALLGRRFCIRWLPDSQWVEAFGPSVLKRWLLAGFGAALTALGAGIAGGCTASLAVSGGAALSPGAFAFMAGMFAAGIPTARWIYRRCP